MVCHWYFGFKDSLKNQQVTILPFHDHAYFSDYTSEHNINVDTTLEKRPSNHIFVTNNIQNEDLGSNSGTSTSLPRSIDINLARDRNGTLGRNGGGGGPGSGCHYTAGPLIPCDPPSPVHSRRSTRSYREVEERPGGTMQRAASTADISQYECSEDGAIRLHMVSNMILLIASLLMIGTGNYIFNKYIGNNYLGNNYLVLLQQDLSQPLLFSTRIYYFHVAVNWKAT